MTNKDIEDNIDEIFKYVGDNGYHENRGARVDCDSCKRVEKAKSRVTALISQLENAARKDQTFKTIQILVKAGSISDRAASLTLATLLATLGDKNA